MNLKRYGHEAALEFPLAILACLWCLEAAALNPEVREFKTGVLQT